MKKILALILALLMMMTVFVGCGSTADVSDDLEFEINEDVEAESEKESYVRIDAMCNNDYDYYMLTATNDDGSTEPINGIDAVGEYIEGETVGELLEATGYKDLAFAEDYEGFKGWLLYNMNEDGVENRVDDTLYTTEKMLEYVMTEQPICFVAKWENTSDDIYEMMGY